MSIMRITMPKHSPATPEAVAAGLHALGAQLRAKRKALLMWWVSSVTEP